MTEQTNYGCTKKRTTIKKRQTPFARFTYFRKFLIIRISFAAGRGRSNECPDSISASGPNSHPTPPHPHHLAFQYIVMVTLSLSSRSFSSRLLSFLRSRNWSHKKLQILNDKCTKQTLSMEQQTMIKIEKSSKAYLVFIQKKHLERKKK